jgi:hypothetical protein
VFACRPCRCVAAPAASGLTSRTAKLRALALTARLKQLSRSTPRGGLHHLQQPHHHLVAASAALPAPSSAAGAAAAAHQQAQAAAQQQQQQQQLAAALSPEDRWVLNLPRNPAGATAGPATAAAAAAAAAEVEESRAGHSGYTHVGRLYTRSGRVRVAVSGVCVVVSTVPRPFHCCGGPLLCKHLAARPAQLPSSLCPSFPFPTRRRVCGETA